MQATENRRVKVDKYDVDTVKKGGLTVDKYCYC